MTRDCGSCAYRRKVMTLRGGLQAFCLHPRCADPLDGIAMYTLKARDPGMPCGPNGDLHSSTETRTGYLSPEQWRTTQ